MTGRERTEAALSPQGAYDLPVVICYEGIFVRDHWRQLTAAPWWHQQSPDLDVQLSWRKAVIEAVGQDWFALPSCAPREERRHLAIEAHDGGVLRVDRRTGESVVLLEPRVGGWPPGGVGASVHPVSPPDSRQGIDALFGREMGEPVESPDDGRADLARALLAGCCRSLYPLIHVASPLWTAYGVWGFEGLMDLVALRPELLEHYCARALEGQLRAVRRAAALGAAGLWIEECMTDMVSPAAFARLVTPFVRPLVEAARAAGLHTVYHYCGDPSGRLDSLLDAGADALAEYLQGRCALLGNVDAVGVLQDGTDAQLDAEIRRQVRAGRRNRSRFVVSIGSPVTPATPVERVRAYCDAARRLGARV